MAARFLVKRLATVNGDFSGNILRQTTTGIKRFNQTENYSQGSSYVSEKVKEGVKKATDGVVNAGDDMKDGLEGAWKAAKETGQNISDAVTGDHDCEGRIQEDKVAVELKDVSQPVDTTEYRGVEELHQQTGGEIKSP